jgi:cytochrome c-type biogenesis protein CcmH/NrfF
LGKGETKEAIVASLVDRFGERVRGAPVNRGLGRAAWLGPVVVVLIGLGVVWAFLRRLRGRPEGAREEPEPKIDDSIRERIEEELKAHRG